MEMFLYTCSEAETACQSGGGLLGVHEVYYTFILNTSGITKCFTFFFDPLTTKFWGSSAPPYQKVEGLKPPPCPPPPPRFSASECFTDFSLYTCLQMQYSLHECKPHLFCCSWSHETHVNKATPIKLVVSHYI